MLAGGALLFCRYAYPPNVLGYCGLDAAGQLLEQVDAGAEDGALHRLVRGFEGAWPYLELIAGATGLDPLDRRVVEAYWVGNDLLTRVGTAATGRSLEDRFRRRVGRNWSWLADAVPSGAVPHHSFHVFGVYPWVGLLRTGVVDQPLTVLDSCRIRWGRVLDVTGPTALVRCRHLLWDGRVVRLGLPRVDEVRVSAGGHRLAGDDLAAGDWCSMHWDWVCDRLDVAAARSLATWSADQLAVAQGVARPGPAMLLS
ncbi:MAG TPA: DUF6390 family protein [Jiangellales bacterium]|nr:DUF6390 family protein [Jiangellales bacterium]